MRSPSPMTAAEFDESLALARNGHIVSDKGANDEVLAALEAISAAAPNPPARLIEAAKAAFARL